MGLASQSHHCVFRLHVLTKFWCHPPWSRYQHRNTKIREMREDCPKQCQFLNFPRLIKKKETDHPLRPDQYIGLGVSRGSWPLEILLCREALGCHQVQVNLYPGLCSKLPASIAWSPLFFWSVIASYPISQAHTIWTDTHWLDSENWLAHWPKFTACSSWLIR